MAECMCNVFDEKHDNFAANFYTLLQISSGELGLSQGGYKINGEETQCELPCNKAK